MSTAERPGQAGRGRAVQWAAIDWCARLRPAIWLRAAGSATDAEELLRRRRLDGAAELDAIWPALTRSAGAALATRQACSHELANAARGLRAPDAADVLAVTASVGWPSAVAGACHLAALAAHVAGFPDPGRVVFRTFTVPEAPGVGWDQAWDLARDAAFIVTCRTLHGLLSSTPGLWTAAQEETWIAAEATVRRALAPVRAELTKAATEWMGRAR